MNVARLSSQIQTTAKVDASAALRAFDMLGDDGPRVVFNVQRSLAADVKARAQARAPGGLKRGWRVVTIADPSNSDDFGVGVMVPDQQLYERRYAKRKGTAAPTSGDGMLRVARWTNHGTGARADKKKIRGGNTSHPGQRAQKYLRPVSRQKQRKEAQEALLRVARRAGFADGGAL